MIRNAMIQLLSSLGYKPLAVSSLSEAREQLANHSLSAVLVDHHLGREDGFAAVSKLREQATAGTTKKPPLFIGMTGLGSLEEPAGHKLDGYLVKPFSADQLQEYWKIDCPHEFRRAGIGNDAPKQKTFFRAS